MSFYFSENSKKRLETCHPDLQRLFNEVIKHIDCSIICGHRSKEDQNKAFLDGKSKVKWPNSKHNSTPSNAVDVIPYPLKDWNDLKQFESFAKEVKEIAKEMNLKIRWGGDFSSLHDAPHFELEK